jgi:addiction module RelE/StbE family toxin
LPNKYQLRFATAVKKDLRKLDKALQHELHTVHFPALQQDPFQANPLSQELRGLWSYHIKHKGHPYRIVYEIDREARVVLVIMIGPRGRFYEALKRRIR